jgi:tetratricopeptide (TPR) repeat protein
MMVRIFTSRIHLVSVLLLAAAMAYGQSAPPPNAPTTRAPKASLQIQQQANPPKKPPVSDEMLMVERARRAEQMGDYNRALSIWKEVLNRSPWNAEAIQGIPRALLISKKIEAADSFITGYLDKSAFRNEAAISSADPTSRFSLMLIQGQIALAKSDEKKAWEIWNAALKQTGNDPDAVRALVNLLQQNRRWEDSEKVIRDFRTTAKQPAFMALELAFSLRGQMNYVSSVEELLVFAASAPSSWQIATNYLNQYPDDSSAARQINGVLKKAINKDKKNSTLWRLMAGYAHKSGRADEAVDATAAADSLSDSGGNLLMALGGQMLQEGEIEPARRAYQRALARKPAPDVSARCELGLGKCCEALRQWDEAKKVYQTFIEKHPLFKEVGEAKFHLGQLLLDHEHNAVAAKQIFADLWQKPVGVSRSQIGLRMGDCHAWLGDFDAAIKTWTDAAGATGNPLSEDGTQALMRMVRANLWRDSTNRALDLLDSIQTGNPANSSFNEAVLYGDLLGEGGFHGAIRAFADADFASFRHDDSLAAPKYQEAADLLKSGRLAEWARFAQALALRDAGKPQQAIAVLDSFVATFTESVDLDRAKYTRAVIRMDDLHDRQGALTEFQNFLIEHPRSLYLEQARRRARILADKIS